MHRIKNISKFSFQFFFNLFWNLINVMLSQNTRKQIQRIGKKNWLQIFFMQRILRINSHVPWPCHWSSQVGSVKNIYMKTFPPFPGLGIGQYIQTLNGIYIGKNVRLGPGIKLLSANHNVDNFEKSDAGGPIVIGDFCWLGADAIILPEVTLGNHVIVGAGAVVTKNFKDNNIILCGNPAKIVKRLGVYKGGIPNSAIINKCSLK